MTDRIVVARTPAEESEWRKHQAIRLEIAKALLAPGSGTGPQDVIEAGERIANWVINGGVQ